MCEFADAQAAVASYRDAYPHAPDDPHLDRYIDGIAAEADQA